MFCQKLCDWKRRQMYLYFQSHERITQTVQLTKQFSFSDDTNSFIDIVSIYCIGQHAAFGHSAAGSYRTFLYGLMWCVLVKAQYWESVIKLLDDICETAVQLLVHTVYRYGGYCCMCHGENIEISFMIILVFHVNYISPFYWNDQFLQIHSLLRQCNAAGVQY